MAVWRSLRCPQDPASTIPPYLGTVANIPLAQLCSHMTETRFEAWESELFVCVLRQALAESPTLVLNSQSSCLSLLSSRDCRCVSLWLTWVTSLVTETEMSDMAEDVG